MKIYKITPNSIHFIKKNGEIQADFYSFDYFQPVLDQLLIAGEYMDINDKVEALEHYLGIKRKFNKYPQIYLSTDFNPATGEGNCNSGEHTSWANAKADTIGTTGSTPVVYSWKAAPNSFFIIRTHEPFDTSSLQDIATVTAAEFRFYRDDSLDAFVNTDLVTLHVVPSTETDPTAIANADLDNFTFSSKGSLAFASTTNGAYNSVTVNIDQVSLTGYSKLGLIDSNDLNNVEPTGRNTLVWQGRGAANPPIFRVTYTLPGGLLTTGEI